MTAVYKYCGDVFNHTKNFVVNNPIKTTAIATVFVITYMTMRDSRWKLGPIVSGSIIKFAKS